MYLGHIRIRPSERVHGGFPPRDRRADPISTRAAVCEPRRMEIAHHEAARELDSRSTDSIDVTLLWYPDNDVASVRVVDWTDGVTFELVLSERDNALDVFEHPFAYAAHRGVELPSRSSRLTVAA